MDELSTFDAGDDRPPICPACGVTMGIVDDDGAVRYACLECGFSDERPFAVSDGRPRNSEG
jgi:ribosomal protein S27AE